MYNILTEFCLSIKIVRLIKTCLNKICSKICIGIHFSGAFSTQNDLKQRDNLSPLPFNFALEYANSKVQEN
jgi:hypothetical protein